MSSTVATDDPQPHPSTVPIVDLTLLSQSDLYTLSLSSYDPNRQDDVVIPKINRSVFNESAGSRKQTFSRLRLHRRTPHLRPSLTINNNNNNNNIIINNNPEHTENSLIINILKQFCKSDPNLHDIVHNNNNNINNNDNNNNNNNDGSIINDNNNREVMEYETLGVKRKRGRPRKQENVVFIRPPGSGKRLRCGGVKKEEVVYDEGKDRGVESENGGVVDVIGLGAVEDPYAGEIRRRTNGMTTEDELLGFLRGLNGHWGSRRRKRRVVEACEFGDVLPKGWKLSLCIKKKEGRVWLFCRRYLSPSGRQFESCKEISAYLISIIGEENLDKQNVVKMNGSDDLALKEASVNAADLVLQEDIKRDGPVANPSRSSSPPELPPVPAKCEEQVSLDAMEVQVENDVKTDQIGSHVENEIEKIKPSPAEPDNSDLVLAGDIALVETNDAHHSGNINTYKESNTDKLVHDLNIVSHSKQDEHSDIGKSSSFEESCDKMGKNVMDDGASRTEVTEQPPDDTVSQSELFGDEPMLSMNDNSNREPEASGEIRVNSVEDKLDFNLDQVIDQDNVSETGWQTGSGDCDGGEDIVITAASVGDGGEDIAVTTTSVGMVDPAVPETIVEKESMCEEKGSHPNMDMDINNTSNELISEKEKVVADTSSGIFLGRFGLDKDGATVVNDVDSAKAVNAETSMSFQKQESHGTYDNNNVDKLSSGITSSRLDELFDVGTDTFGSYAENELNKSLENDVSFSTMEEPVMEISSNKSEVKLDDFNIFRNNEPKCNESEDVMDFSTKSNLEFCSLVPSENEQTFGFQDCLYDNTMEECKEESSERGLLNHFSDDIFENKMYSTPLDGLKFDEDRDLNSNELSLAFGNSNVPSKIDEAFDVHTNLSMVNRSMVEDLKSGSSSVGGLFNLSGNVKTSTFQNSWEGIKPDEFKFKGSGSKFTTGFGSNHGQTREEVVPSGMWRTGDVNQLRSGLPMSSHAHIPSPSSFHSFNIMPGKAGDGQFRLNERYNEGYGVSGLRSGRPEPVEFSFLTAGRSSQHNPHQLQGDSRVFSYNPEMNQQFDSSFWLGKSTMMPNPAGRNQMTGVCALCRNEFHLHPAHFTQDGIASLCPSCSAGMSGHANML